MSWEVRTMQSKTSYFNATLFRKNLTRFWPLWGLASFIGALFPLAVLLDMVHRGWNVLSAPDFTGMYYDAVSAVPVINLVYAALCAMAVWSYLYNARSVGLMHTLPIRREGLFLTNFLSGLSMTLIPYAVTGVLCVVVSLCGGAFDAKGLAVTVLAVLGESFFYFSSATFVAFITGNAFTMPPLYALLHFLALAALALILYRRRRSETAGDVVAVGWLRPVFRYGVAGLCALLGGQFLYSLFWYGFQQGEYYDTLPMVVCLLAAGAIGYYGASMLLAKAFKVFRGSWKGLGIVLAGCALVCCVLHFDLLGVADRVPEASQIQTLEIRIADNTYTLTPEKDADLLEQVRALHQTVVADESYVREMEARRSSTWSEDETPNTAYTGLNLTYTLKSGTRIDRWYSLLITRDRLAQPETYDYLLDQFVNSDTVKARRLHLDDDFWTVSGGSLYIDTRGEGYELGSREGDAILKAVGRDLTAGNWGDYDWFSGDSGSSYAMDLGLDFESADKERYDWISVHVTPAMTETVDCLERLGLVTRADLVTYRQLYPEDYGADGSSIWQEVPHTGENAVVYTEDTTSAMVSPA